jgi:hypothetical protein
MLHFTDLFYLHNFSVSKNILVNSCINIRNYYSNIDMMKFQDTPKNDISINYNPGNNKNNKSEENKIEDTEKIGKNPHNISSKIY